MQGGLAGFETALKRISGLRASGADLRILILLRNPLERAFSHYWREISGHHAMFGRAWRINRKDHPDRYASLYRRSFLDELTDPLARDKFLPPIAEMAARAVAVLGADQVRIAASADIGGALSGLLAEVGHPSAPGMARVPLSVDHAPVFLYGGTGGQSFPLGAPDLVTVPAHTALLFTGKDSDLLSGTTYDLARIAAATEGWSRSFETRDLPAGLSAALAQQADGLARLPETCFLAGQRAWLLDDIARLPPSLSIAPVTVDPVRARQIVGALATSPAERDGKVMVGRGNRLFLDFDMNNVMAQHLGKLRLPDRSVANWVRTIESRYTLCDGRGIAYSMVFAPDTHAIYREAIPALDGCTTTRPVQQILAAYPGPGLHYPLEDLRAARSRGEVCHLTDSHWSSFGALVACRSVLAGMNLGVPLIADNDYTLQDKDLVGDLGVKFDPPRAGRTTEVVLKRAQSRKVWNNGVTNRGHMSYWKGTRRDLPRALLLTDSYGWKFQLFLSQSFSDLFIVHSPLLEREAIDLFRPDVVISLLAERFAYKVPNDLSDTPAIDHARAKSPGAAYPDFSAF